MDMKNTLAITTAEKNEVIDANCHAMACCSCHGHVAVVTATLSHGTFPLLFPTAVSFFSSSSHPNFRFSAAGHAQTT